MKSKEKHLLLLLGVFVLQGSCESKPLVSMSPSFSPIFSGDSVTLICDHGTDSAVSWYFNNAPVPSLTDRTLSIAVAAPKDSGSYECVCGSQRSNTFIVEVLDYLPPAQLSIKSGQPVMRKGDGFSLELQSEDGVDGWQCRVQKDGLVKNITFKSVKGLDSVTIHPYSLRGPQAMYWCHDNSMQLRSSQVTIRTSGKRVSMEMLPRPAVIGENLSLRCVAWGADHISSTVFYKDGKVVQDGQSSTYQINNVTEGAQGRYKCDATFTYPGRTSGDPYNETSEEQELLVQAPPLRTVLSAGDGLVCSCPNCPHGHSYRWYHKERSEPFVHLSSEQSHLGPTQSGVYACRAVWTDRRTSLSNVLTYAPPVSALSAVLTTVVVMVIILFLGGLILGICRWSKKRDNTDPMYEVVALKQVTPGENDYEQLQRQRGARGEYDTLKPAGGERREGEYEGLRKEEMKGGEYNTLGMGEGAAGGGGGGGGGAEGGYQALKTKDRDKEYDTLQGAEE